MGIFRENERDKAIAHFGREAWERALGLLDGLTTKWSLSSLRFIPYYSVNLLFTCHTVEYGPSVLKLCLTSRGEMEAEHRFLKHHGGMGSCRLYRADLESAALLLERVLPGDRLRDHDSLEERVRIFCSLHRDLHGTPPQGAIPEGDFPRYAYWVERIAGYMAKRFDGMELTLAMARAQGIHREQMGRYSDMRLLHGDFHHDNILLGKDGYRVIDPKGALGNPLFDIPRFILNEFDEILTQESPEKIKKVISLISEYLEYPRDEVIKSLFVETAMACSWNVESGMKPEEPELLKTIRFAEGLMQVGDD